MSRPFLIIFVSYFLSVSPLLAQKGRGENSEGNGLFEQGLYEEALRLYQDALEKNPASPIITFNSGDAQYKLEAYDRALESFQQTLSAEDSRLKAHSHYNLGNALYRSGNLQEAVESYKEALRLDPEDPDAKHNLEFVLKELEENPQQQQDQNQNEEDQNKEEDQDQQQQPDESDQEQQQQEQQPDESDSEENQEEEQQNEGEREKDEKEQPNPNQENQPEEQEGSEQQNQQPNQETGNPEELPMSREQADQILEALREDQRDLLRMRTIKRKPAAGGKDW